MSHTYFLDLETRSGVDLKKSNVYRYVTDPDFAILMIAWCYGDSPVSVATAPDQIDAAISVLLSAQASGATLVAHNSSFERVSISAARGLDVGNGELLPVEDWDDTMPLAAEHGYPQSLEMLAQALGGEKKDTAGTRLINLFSKPKRGGGFNTEADKPEEWTQFVEYCRQDVEVLRDVYRKLPGWPTEMERRAWQADQRINDRGIHADRQLAELAVEAGEVNKVEQELELFTLTGVENPASTQQMLAWAESARLDLPNLQAATVTEALARDGLDPQHRRVLELRQELALVASKKYIAALDRLGADDRLRGSFQFFGAHTGRWAGRGVQLQNLPSATIKPEPGESVDAAIAAAVLDLKLGLGSDAHTLKALVRAMFTGPFTVVDYSAIEARVVAWLAGEQWALDAFEAGRDIYVETAERMSSAGNQLTRKEGKVAVLALGYNGGVGSLRAMGAEGTDGYLQGLVTQWREANQNIVGLWAEVENAFRHGDRDAGDRIHVERDDETRRVRLPSGRAVTYHRVGQKWVNNQWGSRVKQLSFADPKRFPARQDTYGGRLVENLTQAVARDIIAEAVVRLQDAGHDVVGHVHDEILVEGAGPGYAEEISAIMTESTAWSEGLPIAAEGFSAPRYRKD